LNRLDIFPIFGDKSQGISEDVEIVSWGSCGTPV
jgi:hypothetical protein